jgi:prepilin-type N-terminal cleavage/methylation domain-containing protein
MRRRGFTLIEVMLAVLLMALLTSAAALHFAGGLRLARSHDAVQELRDFDARSRLFARRYGRGVQIVFDLTANHVSRLEGKRDDDPRCQINRPSGCRVAEVRVGGRVFADGGQARVRISPMGLSQSYAVRLSGPELDLWVVVAGLTGETTPVQDENTMAWMLAQSTRSTGTEALFTTGHDAD